VRIFFPLKIPFLNTRLHFRDHRKILVVDGKWGMIGGFNIGDEYLGKGPLGYWRDTHLRIRGGGVATLQSRFIMDWNYAAKDAPIEMTPENALLYYPDELWEEYGTSRVQIASSGPDSPEKAIYNGYVDLLSRAKKSVYIHSPYFVPDEPMLNAFRIAIRSGVDVRIVIPCKPDHPFIYWTNHSYLGDLIRLGAKGYEYNDGFIHSKASIYDGQVAAVGTANWDVRSFKLNFETQAFVYDDKLVSEMSEAFLKELETNCTEITVEDYNNRPLSTKIKEGICRLFSPIL
jgi:Phosphatidylserine/phosphatidylglycerophosphate/cardiolipin synthases and related enzymes